MRNVVLARSMGMCFGVRRAIRLAMEVAAPGQTTILGSLAHNEEVEAEMARRGFRANPESDRARIPPTPVVLVPAHGISQRDRRRLEDAGKEIVDATCPMVRRIHETAQALHGQGFFVVVIGRRDHVEVQGIVGDLERFAALSDPAEAERYEAARLGVLCQSTTPPSLAQRVFRAIRAKNPGSEIRFVPTVCQATLDRQAAALSLLNVVDALVVVGGRNSNNSLQLANLARSFEKPCALIQNAGDLDPDWLAPFEEVGLTAGASTPDRVIESVHRRLLALCAASPPPQVLQAFG
ncbi:MAG: 4-hydroxy-3-methylbut-2-enyl diphosphate reductase [Candidatus Sumerlaeota bacterium]|nr:4-hydroxy-3-methylbut-2-enyl diphosphate reductase [Candidatus Sumerlaeota bacterium]